MAENYPFSVTFHGKDIVDVRGHMVAFLADNVTPGVAKQTPPSPEAPVTSAPQTKKPRKSATTKKTKTKDSPAVSADTDTDVKTNSSGGITPEDHPNISLAYNNALERLMELYNGSPEGSYEVTLLLEEYRVASFREIPEDRGVELLGKAEDIGAKLAATNETEQESA